MRLRDRLWCWFHDVCTTHRIRREAGVCRLCEISASSRFEKRLSQVRKNAQ